MAVATKGRRGISIRYRPLVPYILLLPALAWLAIFFLIPIFYLGLTSLQEGTALEGFDFSWRWQNFTDAVRRFDEQFIRSFRFAGIATVAAFFIGYPLAYFIAFRAGRLKNLFLFLVVVPFFTTFLIRTLAWKIILADEGFVLQFFADIGLLSVMDAVGFSQNGRVLATATAVVAGITYNFLPFMVLPIYVSLERIDLRLVEAAQDLYGGPIRAFWRVVFPLSLPGVFAGTLLTFIPAAGDFVNADLLGGTGDLMIGNVIQRQFLSALNYPAAAATSFVLMASILVVVVVYMRLLGAEELEEVA